MAGRRYVRLAVGLMPERGLLVSPATCSPGSCPKAVVFWNSAFLSVIGGGRHAETILLLPLDCTFSVSRVMSGSPRHCVPDASRHVHTEDNFRKFNGEIVHYSLRLCNGIALKRGSGQKNPSLRKYQLRSDLQEE